MLRRNRIHFTMEEWTLLRSSIHLIDSAIVFHAQSRNFHPPSYDEAMATENYFLSFHFFSLQNQLVMSIRTSHLDVDLPDSARGGEGARAAAERRAN